MGEGGHAPVLVGEAIAALAIPTVAIIANAVLKLARLRIEEAKARAGVADPTGEVGLLRDDVAQLRHELGEVQERLDFTERMLAQQREAPKLEGR